MTPSTRAAKEEQISKMLFINPFPRIVLYCTLLCSAGTQGILYFPIVVEPGALSLMLRHLLRHV